MVDQINQDFLNLAVKWLGPTNTEGKLLGKNVRPLPRTTKWQIEFMVVDRSEWPLQRWIVDFTKL